MADDREIEELLGRVGAELDRQLRTPTPWLHHRRDHPHRSLLLASAAALLVLGGVAGVWFTTQRGPADDGPRAVGTAPGDDGRGIETTTVDTTTEDATSAPAVTPSQRVTVPPTSVAPSSTPEACSTHKVRSGESLWQIARNYGITLESLILVNGLQDSDPDTIVTDQVLDLPCVQFADDLTTPFPADATGELACIPATTPPADLPYVVFDPVPNGYGLVAALRHTAGMQPPAALFAWDPDDVWDGGDPAFPFVVSRNAGGEATVLGYPGAIPVEILESTAGAVALEEVAMIGELPDHVRFVDSQRREVVAHLAEYHAGDRILAVEASSDLPLTTGLPPGATIETGVRVGNDPRGFVLRTPPSAGEPYGSTGLFWRPDGDTVYTIGTNDEHTDRAELVALADTLRPANPAEVALFYDAIATNCELA